MMPISFQRGQTFSAGRYADHLLDCFGPQRLMFGSDWPVCTLAASYRAVVAVARMISSRLDRGELEAVFSGTAVTAYGLRLPVLARESPVLGDGASSYRCKPRSL